MPESGLLALAIVINNVACNQRISDKDKGADNKASTFRRSPESREEKETTKGEGGGDQHLQYYTLV